MMIIAQPIFFLPNALLRGLVYRGLGKGYPFPNKTKTDNASEGFRVTSGVMLI